MSFANSYLGKLRAAMGTTPLIAVGVRILIQDTAGRFLVMRRADSGLWGLPGGSMELGESLIDAAHREAFEETGMKLTDVTPFGLSSDPQIEQYTYPNGDVVQNVSLLVHALGKGMPQPNDGEATSLYFTPDSQIDPAVFVATELPTFGHWARFRETGQFQIV